MRELIVNVFLPFALALIMFGLGLTLTVGDFRRVTKMPKAVIVALACQLVLIPAICVGVVLLFGLTPALAVGMMLVAASPGGTTANLFSHLAGGDVAFNITLLAVNSIIAVVTLPIVVSLSVAGFMGTETSIRLPADKMISVFAVVLVPVAIGMFIRHRFTTWAERMRGPVKIGSVVVLALVIVIAVVQEWALFRDNATSIGLVCLVFSVLSLLVGFYVPRLLRIGRRQAIASAMEIGTHNTVLAVAIALNVIGSTEIAIPAAVYGLVAFIPAGIAAYLLSRTTETETESTEAVPA